MVTVLLIVLTVFGILAVAFMAAAHEIEMRHERWYQYNHPPDSVLEEDDEDEQP